MFFDLLLHLACFLFHPSLMSHPCLVSMFDIYLPDTETISFPFIFVLFFFYCILYLHKSSELVLLTILLASNYAVLTKCFIQQVASTGAIAVFLISSNYTNIHLIRKWVDASSNWYVDQQVLERAHTPQQSNSIAYLSDLFGKEMYTLPILIQRLKILATI